MFAPSVTRKIAGAIKLGATNVTVKYAAPIIGLLCVLDLFVGAQVARFREPGIAYVTDVIFLKGGWAVRVFLLLVDAKIAGLRERSATDVTGEVLLSLAMHRLMLELPVSAKVASSAEGPLTHLTGVRLLSTVDLLVQLKEGWV